MEKLFFAIYKDENKAFCHIIVYRRSKKVLREELKEKGYVVTGIFSEKDVEKVLAGEFFDTTISEKTVVYLEENLDEWEKHF